MSASAAPELDVSTSAPISLPSESVEKTVTFVQSPKRVEGEWANTWTHGFGAVGAAALGLSFVMSAMERDIALAIACGAYAFSVVGTFTASMLSHWVTRQPMLDRMRALDQAMIYAMISGTYTPIIFRFAPDGLRMPLLATIWVVTLAGIGAKLFAHHRVNNVATVSYLLLGWLPALPMIPHVPLGLGMGMALGGIVYSIAVVVLVNDHRVRYFHALWHVLVMAAAYCHYATICHYVLA